MCVCVSVWVCKLNDGRQGRPIFTGPTPSHVFVCVFPSIFYPLPLLFPPCYPVVINILPNCVFIRLFICWLCVDGGRGGSLGRGGVDAGRVDASDRSGWGRSDSLRRPGEAESHDRGNGGFVGQSLVGVSGSHATHPGLPGRCRLTVTALLPGRHHPIARSLPSDCRPVATAVAAGRHRITGPLPAEHRQIFRYRTYRLISN